AGIADHDPRGRITDRRLGAESPTRSEIRAGRCRRGLRKGIRGGNEDAGPVHHGRSRRATGELAVRIAILAARGAFVTDLVGLVHLAVAALGLLAEAAQADVALAVRVDLAEPS